MALYAVRHLCRLRWRFGPAGRPTLRMGLAWPSSSRACPVVGVDRGERGDELIALVVALDELRHARLADFERCVGVGEFGLSFSFRDIYLRKVSASVITRTVTKRTLTTTTRVVATAARGALALVRWWRTPPTDC